MGLRNRKKKTQEQVVAVEEVVAVPVDVTAKKTHTNTDGALEQHKEFIQEAEIIAKRKRLFSKTLDEVEKLKPENIAQSDAVCFSQGALVDLLSECLLTVEMAEAYNVILADMALESD